MSANDIAIDSIKARIQRIAFDANLFDLGIADYPYSEKCSKEKKKLMAIIKRLEGRNISKPSLKVDVSQLRLME